MAVNSLPTAKLRSVNRMPGLFCQGCARFHRRDRLTEVVHHFS